MWQPGWNDALLAQALMEAMRTLAQEQMSLNPLRGGDTVPAPRPRRLRRVAAWAALCVADAMIWVGNRLRAACLSQ